MEYFYPQCNRLYRAAIGIDVQIRNLLDKNKMCIYRIWFGNKYYIGSTKNMARRRWNHVVNLNKLIYNLQTGEASNYNILKHLFMNLDITCGEMELLKEVETEAELSPMEEMYLKEAVDDENCLNYSQKAIRPSKKEKIHNPIAIAVSESLLNSVTECVFRLYCNEKYVIVKGKSLAGSLKQINSAILSFSKKDREDWEKDHLYYHLIGYLLDLTEEPTYSATLLMMTPNPYDLLKKEQMELWENQSDPNCLNNTFDAYIPVYKEETGLYGWINRGQYAAFMKWKNINMPLPQEPANCVPLNHEHSLCPERVVLSETDASLLLSRSCHQQTQKSAFCHQISWQSFVRYVA